MQLGLARIANATEQPCFVDSLFYRLHMYINQATPLSSMVSVMFLTYEEYLGEQEKSFACLLLKVEGHFEAASCRYL